jgi:hypothetical protein
VRQFLSLATRVWLQRLRRVRADRHPLDLHAT